MYGFEYGNISRVIDTKALEDRIKKDGRSRGAIAAAAGISDGTLYTILKRGTATNWTINQVRLALNPKMRYETISPDSLQHKNICEKTENDKTELQSQKAYYEALSNDFEKLCNRYSVVDVIDLAVQVQADIMCHLNECGFDLLELHDEALKKYHAVEV